MHWNTRFDKTKSLAEPLDPCQFLQIFGGSQKLFELQDSSVQVGLTRNLNAKQKEDKLKTLQNSQILEKQSNNQKFISHISQTLQFCISGSKFKKRESRKSPKLRIYFCIFSLVIFCRSFPPTFKQLSIELNTTTGER